jgi:hypothetical protein
MYNAKKFNWHHILDFSWLYNFSAICIIFCISSHWYWRPVSFPRKSMSCTDIIIISLALFDLHHAQIGWRTLYASVGVGGVAGVSFAKPNKASPGSLVNILSIGFLEPWRLSGPSAATLLHHRKPLWSPFSAAGRANKRKITQKQQRGAASLSQNHRRYRTPQRWYCSQGWRWLRPAERGVNYEAW